MPHLRHKEAKVSKYLEAQVIELSHVWFERLVEEHLITGHPLNVSSEPSRNVFVPLVLAFVQAAILKAREEETDRVVNLMFLAKNEIISIGKAIEAMRDGLTAEQVGAAIRGSRP